MQMTKLIAEKIDKEHLDVGILSQETGIAADKLKGLSKTPLNAEEFLTVCAKLQLSPEQLWEHRQDRGSKND